MKTKSRIDYFQSKFKFVPSVFLLLFTAQLNAQSILPDSLYTGWNEVLSKDKITIHTRTIVNNGIKHRDTKISMIIDQSFPLVLNAFIGNSDAWSCLDLTEEVRDYAINRSLKKWNTYILLDLPWPLGKKDLVVQNNCFGQPYDDQAVIKITAKPHLLPEINGVHRIKSLNNIWTLEKIDSARTGITYYIIGSGKSLIPRWIIDPIVQEQMVNLFNCINQRSQRIAFAGSG